MLQQTPHYYEHYYNGIFFFENMTQEQKVITVENDVKLLHPLLIYNNLIYSLKNRIYSAKWIFDSKRLYYLYIMFKNENVLNKLTEMLCGNNNYMFDEIKSQINSYLDKSHAAIKNYINTIVVQGGELFLNDTTIINYNFFIYNLLKYYNSELKIVPMSTHIGGKNGINEKNRLNEYINKIYDTYKINKNNFNRLKIISH